MASRDLSRTHFLQLLGGAFALGMTGCDSGGDGETDGGGSTGSTTSASTDPTAGTNPTASTDPSTSTSTSTSTSATDPTEGSTGGSTSTGNSTGSTSTGSSTGEGSTSDTTSGDESSSSSSSTGGENLCGDGATDVQITGHAGHGITIAADQLQPGTALNDLDITNGLGHSHAIDLSADDVDALLAGGEVTVSSTAGGGGDHTHQVTLACV